MRKVVSPFAPTAKAVPNRPAIRALLESNSSKPFETAQQIQSSDAYAYAFVCVRYSFCGSDTFGYIYIALLDCALYYKINR